MSKVYQSIIVGSGFGGLCMAAKLKMAGLNDFLILEKASEVGGTWRENTYPGAECDIASAYYSYSFAQNPTWDFKWAKQKQILSYLIQFSSDYELRDHLRFEHEVTSAKYDDDLKIWTLITKAGEQFQCHFFIPALGQLHHPNLPSVKGLDDYQGVYFHSAQWQHDVDLSNKSVAIIGNAASAVQIIPELAKRVKRLSVYQRSANWIIPKGDRPYTRLEHFIARHFPKFSSLYRFQFWSLGEFGLLPMIRGSKLHSKIGEWVCKREIKKNIQDPDLQKTLTPNYPIGAKRILLTDNFYPTLALDNVELISRPIDHFSTNGIVDVDSNEREHDVVVFATGFKSNPFLASISITGKDSLNLREHWSDGAYAYLGVTTESFPNMFMLYGPNTNTGHTSVVFFHEVQADYIVKLIQKVAKGAIEIKPNIESDFNQEIQARLSTMAWNKVDNSWYKDGQRITNNWPGSSLEYKRRLNKPEWSHYRIETGT